MNEVLINVLLCWLKSAAIVLMCFVLAAGLRRLGYTAQARHRLWLIGFVLLALLPMLSLLLPNLTIALPYARFGLASPDLSVPGEHLPDLSALFWVIGGWALGALLMLMQLLFGRISLSTIWRSARPLQHPMLTVCAPAVGVNHPVLVRVSTLAVGPLTWGRHVLLPASATNWPDAQLRDVLWHELSHVARRDSDWLLLASLLRAAYWFNPVVWWAVKLLRREQELACDEHVLEHGADPVHYARSLLDIAAELAPPIAVGSASAMAMRSHIEVRVHELLGGVRPKPLGGLGLVLIAAAMTISSAMVAATQLIDRRLQLAPLAALAPLHADEPILVRSSGLEPLDSGDDIPVPHNASETR